MKISIRVIVLEYTKPYAPLPFQNIGRGKRKGKIIVKDLQRRKRERERADWQSKKRLDESEMSEVFNTPIDSESDPIFSEPQTSKKSLFTNRKLRSSKEAVLEETNEKQGSAFPQVKVRTGRQSLNESLM